MCIFDDTVTPSGLTKQLTANNDPCCAANAYGITYLMWRSILMIFSRKVESNLWNFKDVKWSFSAVAIKGCKSQGGKSENGLNFWITALKWQNGLLQTVVNLKKFKMSFIALNHKKYFSIDFRIFYSDIVHKQPHHAQTDMSQS